MPLPGGADLGDHPYQITADFGDVLSLAPPQSSVKVNDVAVGRVTKISLAPDGWRARVTMKVNGKIGLPANAYAHLEQSSLLGEKYIQLSPPAKGKEQGTLADGDRIPLTRTNRNPPEVEEVFGALSMLLNGGGVQQLKTITTELNKALTGQEPQVKSMLHRVDKLVTNLDDHRGDITAALDGVNRLSSTLAGRKQQVGTVLTKLSPRHEGPGEAARLAHDDAPLPGHPLGRRRRHRQQEQGGHRRRPQGHRPHPAGAGRLRKRPPPTPSRCCSPTRSRTRSCAV